MRKLLGLVDMYLTLTEGKQNHIFFLMNDLYAKCKINKPMNATVNTIHEYS